jgi:(S)-ureidoglycine-glyoxylate aminotransferase
MTVTWARGGTRPILMIPGPTELPYPVVEALNAPPSIQYDPSFDDRVLEPTMAALRQVFQTDGEVFVLPGSGRTALEAGAVSIIEPGDKVIVVVAGVFGVLMREIMTRLGAQVTEFPVEWGRPLDLGGLRAEAERVRPKAIHLVHNETSTGTTYPAEAVGRIARSVGALFFLDTVSAIAGIDVRTREWGVDLNMTGSQKCLGAPLGLAVVGVSDRAWEAMAGRRGKATSYAYDLLQWKKTWIPASRGGVLAEGAPRSQPISIPTHLTAAMRVAAELIIAEGLEHRFARHAVAARALRAGLDTMRLELFPDASILSNTVTCIQTPNGIAARAVVETMRDRYGILIGTGLDRFRGNTLRIGTMAMTASPLYVLPTLSALELTLRDLGYKCEAGAAVAAAQTIFADAS